MAARDKNAYRLLGELRKEGTKRGNVRVIQDRESWNRTSLTAVK